jgi:anti-sigma factor RsiW
LTGGGSGGSAHLGDALSALLDGELADEEAARARPHLDACPACAAELAAVSQARSWLRALPSVEPPAGFLAGLLAPPPAPAGDVVRLRRRRLGLAALAASAAASLALLGLASPPEPPAAPRVAQLVEAHATAAGSGDPVSQLVSAGVPVSFRR